MNLASDLCKRFEPLPIPVKVHILLFMGQATTEARSVSRCLATEWLVPGCLEQAVIVSH